MSKNVPDPKERVEMTTRIRRLRASILELMVLMAALAVSFAWPGLSVPAGLLFLCARGQRRDFLCRQTRVGLGQIDVTSYLLAAVGLLLALPVANP
jgi:hypothetical protein